MELNKGNANTMGSKNNLDALKKNESTVHSCGSCGKVFRRDETKNMPFCSERCQNLDLAQWLDEKFGLPYEGEAEVEHQSNDFDDDPIE